MKPTVACCILLPLIFIMSSCRPPGSGTETCLSSGSTPAVTADPMTTAATEAPESTSGTVKDQYEPDTAGNGTVLFDIYSEKAKADLNGDGPAELIELEPGAGFSVVRIDGKPTVVEMTDIAEKFALTDIDASDSLLEILLTDRDGSKNAASSYIFWWDGESLIYAGVVAGLGFDGILRKDLEPQKWFDAKGTVYMPVMTDEFIEIWYMGRFTAHGEQRMLDEELYEAEPLNGPGDVMLKAGHMCALLIERDEGYYEKEHNVIWDYASWPHINGRETEPEPRGVFSVIAAGPEPLTVKKVFGTQWIKMATVDGYEGWIKVDDKKIKGYDKVMYIDIYDMFEIE